MRKAACVAALILAGCMAPQEPLAAVRSEILVETSDARLTRGDTFPVALRFVNEGKISVRLEEAPCPASAPILVEYRRFLRWDYRVGPEATDRTWSYDPEAAEAADRHCVGSPIPALLEPGASVESSFVFDGTVFRNQTRGEAPRGTYFFADGMGYVQEGYMLLPPMALWASDAPRATWNGDGRDIIADVVLAIQPQNAVFVAGEDHRFVATLRNIGPRTLGSGLACAPPVHFQVTDRSSGPPDYMNASDGQAEIVRLYVPSDPVCGNVASWALPPGGTAEFEFVWNGTSADPTGRGWTYPEAPGEWRVLARYTDETFRWIMTHADVTVRRRL